MVTFQFELTVGTRLSIGIHGACLQSCETVLESEGGGHGVFLPIFIAATSIGINPDRMVFCINWVVVAHNMFSLSSE